MKTNGLKKITFNKFSCETDSANLQTFFTGISINEKKIFYY